ncbi:MAG: type I methionyl aminopeptidase [Malacoplasma sp.]|nr:type I methionyl aminopeptidase [Malacoplasma sp.]
MIILKTPEDINSIKKACEIWKKVRNDLIKQVKVGMSTKDVDELANKLITSYKAIPTFYKLYDFPGYICISVNEELIHGIGSEGRILQPNDMITCDIGITYEGHVCDAAFTWILPPNTDEAKQKILKTTYNCLMSAIKQVYPNNYLGNISHTIQEIAEDNGYKVIRDYGGHGCGNLPHEDPMILCYGTKDSGIKMVPNMVFCIEPMLLEKSYKYKVDSKNNWTVSSKNHKLTCHYEHMVLVTNEGCEVLTYQDGEDNHIN